MWLHHHTPVFKSIPLSNCLKKEVLLKMECFQEAGSFKIRGIGFLCQEVVNEGKTHLVSSSGGNAGFAVAYAGNRLGVTVTVIVPESTPEDVRDKIRSQGAQVRIEGEVWDEAHEAALSFAASVDGAYIPPFDHPTIWEGHATLVDELAYQCLLPPDAIILSVGGGGLLCGVIDGLQRNNWPGADVITAETIGAASLATSIREARLVKLDHITSIATTLGAKQVSEKALQLAMSEKVIPVTMTDQAALDACLRFVDDHRVLVEPACGAALSLIYDNAAELERYESVLVIVCGGIGVSLDKLKQWKRKKFDSAVNGNGL